MCGLALFVKIIAIFVVDTITIITITILITISVFPLLLMNNYHRNRQGLLIRSVWRLLVE